MNRLVLIKHSQPAIDPARPAREWQLSEEGVSRCDWLADELARLDVSVLCSSPEPKARETAERVARRLGLETTTVAGLHENDRRGFPFIEDVSELEDRFREFFANPDRRVIGEESADEALARFSEALESFLARHDHENVAVVAHGTVISLYAAARCGVAPFETWDALNPLPAYLVVRFPECEIEVAPRGCSLSEEASE